MCFGSSLLDVAGLAPASAGTGGETEKGRRHEAGFCTRAFRARVTSSSKEITLEIDLLEYITDHALLSLAYH